MADSSNSAGIRNAEVRYKNRVDDLSTASHIRASAQQQNQNRREEASSQKNDPRMIERGRSAQLTDQKIQMEAERLFREQGLEYEPEEVQDIIKAEPPKKPNFPYFMIIIALIKDILDSLTLTGFGYAVSLAISVVIGAVIFIWTLSRGSGPVAQVQMRKSIKRFWAANIVDLIPAVNILPLEVIFVCWTYFGEKNAVDGATAALGKLQSFKKRLGR